MPVENSKPVIGHRNISAPMGAFHYKAIDFQKIRFRPQKLGNVSSVPDSKMAKFRMGPLANSKRAKNMNRSRHQKKSPGGDRGLVVLEMPRGHQSAPETTSVEMSCTRHFGQVTNPATLCSKTSH
jgi:hypothetical protein